MDRNSCSPDTDLLDPEICRARAAQCLRLADGALRADVADRLRAFAQEYQARALELEASGAIDGHKPAAPISIETEGMLAAAPMLTK
jgi:hypothetical protein